MYYIPSAPIPKVPQTPSLLRVISYGAFLCDRYAYDFIVCMLRCMMLKVKQDTLSSEPFAWDKVLGWYASAVGLLLWIIQTQFQSNYIYYRLVVATLSECDQGAAQLIVRVDRHDELSDASDCLRDSPASEGDLAISISSQWGSLTGNDSLLVRVGLAPGISQDSGADISVPARDDSLEIEVARTRNASVDAMVYTEISLHTQEEDFI
jgi:hypothetical protein